MWYALALFVHILGAIALFVAVSLTIIALVRIRGASTLEQVREWAAVLNGAGKSMFFLALIILVPAVSMVMVAWGFTTPWVMAALITFVVLAIMGATVSGRTIERVVALARTAEPGPIPDEVRTQLLAPSLWLAEAIRLTLLIGILCLMTIKPAVIFSWLILVAMLLLGIILGVLVQRSPRQISRKEQFL